jgi:hypothetical protein
MTRLSRTWRSLLQVLEQVLDKALADHANAVRVSGAPGSGKSTLCQAIGPAAAERDRRAFVISPPSGAADAGVLGLASLARLLGGPEITRKGWGKLRLDTARLLREQNSEVLLVIDEPSKWLSAGGLFARRAEEALETLAGSAASWPTIICDQGVSADGVKLPAARSEEADFGAGHPLSEAAESLRGMSIATALITPLQQRLAIALLAWGAEPRFTDSHRLGAQLAKTLTSRRHGRPLWAVWQKLALSRTSVDQGMLDSLGGGRLSDLAAVTLQSVLLDGGERVHDVLRAIPDDRAPDPELIPAQRRQVHELLFEYHYGSFEVEAAEGLPEAADHAAEALFHAGELQDETRMTLLSVDLVEELNALGHRLGTVQRDHAGAETAFRRALLADRNDSYAIHHLAFHLDAQGLELEEVDDGYRRAVEIDPGQPSWHARRVSFLADTAQLQAARRAWAQVESALADDRGDSSMYWSLHLPVATSLLSLSELSFCAYVLDGVPEHARGPQYRELQTLLSGRLAGQDRGAFVPAPRSGSAWWREPPERLPERDTEGRLLTGWLAGRVDAVDEDGVDLHVAQVGAGDSPPKTGRLRMAFDVLSERLLDTIDLRIINDGTFVEIGRYRGSSAPDRTGIIVLDPPPVRLPVDILPASRWKAEFRDASS